MQLIYIYINVFWHKKYVKHQIYTIQFRDKIVIYYIKLDKRLQKLYGDNFNLFNIKI